jgi:4-amino-4-deoxy-L-arabinose transferase-like glycosyltransferase
MVEPNYPSPSGRSILSGRHVHLAVLVFLSGLLLFLKLPQGDLSGYDDALYAHEGEQILIYGDWETIRCNGGFNFEYPPMFFWMEALSMSAWGVTDFAAKFPVALSGLLTILAVFFMGRSFDRSDLFPYCAAWTLMLTQYFLKYSTHAMTDVPYALFFTLAILFYVRGLKRPWFFFLCGLAIACAILTRSVLGLIPFAVVLCHVLLTRRLGLFRSPQFLAGMILALAVPCLWYVPMYRMHGRPFLEQTLSVVSSKVSFEGETDAHSLLWNWLRYPGLLLKLYWPWLPLMAIGFWNETGRAFRKRDVFSILLILWVLFILVPMSLAEAKTLRYIMPVFPAFALLAAVPLSRWLMRIRNRTYFCPGYIVICLLVVGIAVFSRPYLRAGEIRVIGAAVESHVPVSERYFLYTGGEIRDDYRNQYLWYSKRYLDLLPNPAALTGQIEKKQAGYFVMDRPSYERIVAPSGADITTISETGQWIFFRKNG